MNRRIPIPRFRLPRIPRIPLPAALRRREHLPRYAVIFAVTLELFEWCLVAFGVVLTIEAILPGLVATPPAYAVIVGALALWFGALAWVSWRSKIPFPAYAHPTRHPGVWVGIAWLAFTLTLSFLPPVAWIPPIVIAVSLFLGYLYRALLFDGKKAGR